MRSPLLLAAFLSLLRGPGHGSDYIYRGCQDTLWVMENYTGDSAIQNMVKKKVERHELHMDGEVGATDGELEAMGDDARGTIKRSRYRLEITWKEPRLNAEMWNEEACVTLFEKHADVGKIHGLEGKSPSAAMVELWSALTYREGLGFGGKSNYESLSQRLKEGLNFGKAGYHDFNQKPRWHPTAPYLARFTHEASGHGPDGQQYRPGEDLELTFTYLECDDVPIKGFDPTVTLLGGPPGAAIKGPDGKPTRSLKVVTDEEGEARITLSTRRGSTKRLHLGVQKEGLCEESYLVYEDFFLEPEKETRWRGTLNIGAEATHNGVMKVSGHMTIRFRFTHYLQPKWFQSAAHDQKGSFGIIGQGTATQSIRLSPLGNHVLDDRDTPGGFKVLVLGVLKSGEGEEPVYDLEIHKGNWEDLFYEYRYYFRGAGGKSVVQQAGNLTLERVPLRPGTHKGRAAYIKLHAISNAEGDDYSLTLTRDD